MPDHVLKLLLDSKNELSIKTVSVLGIAYKGNVEDIRETPSKKLIELLLENNFNVMAHDPIVKNEIIESFNVKAVEYEEALSCDCVILMTDHDLYKDLKPDMLKNKYIISTRPILDSEEFREAGINFQAIGDISN